MLLGYQKKKTSKAEGYMYCCDGQVGYLGTKFHGGFYNLNRTCKITTSITTPLNSPTSGGCGQCFGFFQRSDRHIQV